MPLAVTLLSSKEWHTFQFGGQPEFRWPAWRDKCKINAKVVFAKILDYIFWKF